MPRCISSFWINVFFRYILWLHSFHTTTQPKVKLIWMFYRQMHEFQPTLNLTIFVIRITGNSSMEVSNGLFLSPGNIVVTHLNIVFNLSGPSYHHVWIWMSNNALCCWFVIPKHQWMNQSQVSTIILSEINSIWKSFGPELNLLRHLTVFDY